MSTDSAEPAGGYDFDFNAVQPPLDGRLSTEADVALRHALATTAAETASTRKAAIAALDAARLALRDLVQPIGDEAAEAYDILDDALVSVTRELRDLAAGGAPGPITEPMKVNGRPANPEAKIVDQARRVLAYEWLQLLGERPKQAAAMVASATGRGLASEVERVQQLAADFKGPRQARALGSLWYEVECAVWGDGGRTVADASPGEVIA
ncbi:MAG TPA: hypothetical protein VKS60_24895 [Stellaceae bacterium]|nr:hypothetical protein [Stellaceae bacterium]